ncbi:MAG: eukaryotic-like serine/threonine-protein kinase [Clostridiales bacterium]|nr:eukaryotic-like serine/threonine-protein kinase [Clostridiales bacterium]MDN5282312.1 eukaryotic-like serine/threonine-protein kinase [Candidatus Ozemobacter sp.]
MADYTNKKAGNYTVLKKLGDGGFATVYLAQHSVLEKKAAVKFLLEDWVDEPDVVARFFDEARTMERLHQHPNIVKILDIATQEKCASEGLPPYFIMEYIEGHSLEDLMKSDQGFTLDEIVKIMTCALSALQHCHDLGVVHRDIKPSNILITANGEVRLTDFGIAKARKNTSKTGEGLTLGSTDYMSPEQALGKRDLDYRSDIYSLGITLYQMVCDRLPFTGDSPNAVALKHIQEHPIPPIQVNEAVPHRLNDVILKAIEKDRDDRYQSCQEMLEALENLDEPEEENGADVPAVDITEMKPEAEDEDFIGDYDPTTSQHTTSKFAARPPVELIHSLRIILIILAFTGLFLAVFKGYYLLTQAKVQLATIPAGANVILNGETVGSSPVSLSLPPMGYLMSFYKEGFATSTHYFDIAARKKIVLEQKLLELNPDFSDFNAALAKLEDQLNAMPSSNFKTKKEQERYQSARAALAKRWNETFSQLEKKIEYVEPNLALIKLGEETGNLKKLEEYYKSLAKRKPSAEAFTMAGLVNKKMKDNKEALRLYMEAWTRNRNYAFLLNSLGEFFLEDNKVAKARQYLEMSLFLYPDQKEIKEKLDALK